MTRGQSRFDSTRPLPNVPNGHCGLPGYRRLATAAGNRSGLPFDLRIAIYPFERFTERAKKVLTLAQEEAERSHHSYIGTEHLLLGLLREHDGLAAHALANLGVDIDAVRQVIESVLGRDERIIIQQI